ncbi:MAG: LPS export ABC transporter periplasmic protein LptC [Coxiellaceae bacterium]|nr:LPS export ABC transporter periplasmic protein LptC [Coxiellaceae bacterium]
MTKSNQQLTLWSIIIALSALGVYLIFHSLESKPTKQTLASHPDAYMVNAVYEDYDDDGRLHAFLKTPKMTHFPDKDSAQFLTPDVIMYTAAHVPWHVTAQHGRSQHGTSKVFLWGDVIIHQPTRSGLPETTIKTSQMTIYPDRQYAETKKPVTIIRPGSITQGIGLKANFKTGIFQLLSHSRGQYAPNSQ